ncbi:hypothetical protein PHLCEN_2v9844 [Hermanssonia centrifuga]|uniref:Uncharacterized protein n=1 Tax=Hermanssonia centrifuga TaxID=98765 RepID=A0A2R6NPK7_9APHY|nr:hypothetical protein PHLCEN_2v9844 [Hermanssonia centrifuga]
MFDSQNGRNRHRGKPVMYDLTSDSEWGMLSPRPLARWSKRRPTKRALIIIACLFIAGVYGVRVWSGPHHAVQTHTTEVITHQQHQERPEKHVEENWDDRPKPPLFERYHVAEMALPQHHVSDPFASGRKFLWVENHVHGESGYRLRALYRRKMS